MYSNATENHKQIALHGCSVHKESYQPENEKKRKPKTSIKAKLKLKLKLDILGFK